MPDIFLAPFAGFGLGLRAPLGQLALHPDATSLRAGVEYRWKASQTAVPGWRLQSSAESRDPTNLS